MKWMRRLLLGALVLILALAVLGVVGSAVARVVAARSAASEFPPPGRLIEIGRRTAHIDCAGSGSPTILLEAGLDDQGSTSWAPIREELAEISRVCAYDRAGILWSERGDEPRDGERIAGELHALLEASGERPPYVLVGHSLGGLLVRVYDRRFPGEAAGFVFVDASHPEQEARFPAELRERSRAGSPPPWLIGLAAPYLSVARHDTPRTAYRWRSLPGLLAEAAAIDSISAQASRTRQLGDRPVVVLTAGETLNVPGLSPGTNAAARRTWVELHGELSRLSSNSDHRIVTGAGHYLHADRPEAVVSAIRDVVIAVRTGAELRRESAPTAMSRAGGRE